MARVGDISLTSAVFLIIGNVIGAGTFTTTGLMLAQVGHPLMVLLVWLVAGIVMLFGAACYGALARQIPESGGEYLFLSRIFHPALGCLAGWISLLVGFSAPIAVCAYSLGEYFSYWGDFDARLTGSCFIILVTLLHSISTGQGIKIQNLVISVKLLLLTLFMVLTADQFSTDSIMLATMPMEFSLDALVLCFIWAFFAYSGWNSVIYIAEELENPERNLMLATMIGSFLVLVIYLMLNFSILGYGYTSELEGRVDIMLRLADLSGSNWTTMVTLSVVNLALISSLSALIMLGPRVYAKMAADGFLPMFLGAQEERYHRPIIFQASIALLILWLGSFEQMFTCIGYTLGLSCVLTVLGLAKMKLSDNSIHVPCWPLGPAIFVASVVLAIVYHIYHHPLYSLLGLVLVMPGLFFWFCSKVKNG